MQRKNHLRLILGIILIGSLAVLLIGYFALRKPAAENPSMPAPSISSSSASPSATELPTGLAKADSTNQPQRPSHPQKGLLLTRRIRSSRGKWNHASDCKN